MGRSIKSLRILQETVLDSFGFRNRLTEEELSNLIHPVGTNLEILPHLQNFYENKFDIVFNVVK